MHTHPSKGERVVSKAKIFQGKYEATCKMEFPEGWEVQTKKPLREGVWTFPGTTQWTLLSAINITTSSTNVRKTQYWSNNNLSEYLMWHHVYKNFTKISFM